MLACDARQGKKGTANVDLSIGNHTVFFVMLRSKTNQRTISANCTSPANLIIFRAPDDF